MTLVTRGEPVGRKEFRRFAERLNKRVQNLDTSVLTQAELFGLYESIWMETKKELSLGGTRPSENPALDRVGT
jgi:predicted metallo-beta-lactamase superfamily hydrolase